MTEPPEPRDPTEGGGADDDYGGWDVERDDQLLDALGSGADLDFPGLLDQVVSDSLAGERDRARDRELPESTAPDAVLAEYARREKAMRDEFQRMIDEGNFMSAAESAGRLRELAGSSLSKGLAEQIKTDLEEGRAAALTALGEGHSESGNVSGPFGAAIEKADELFQLVSQAYSNLSDVAGRIG